MLGLFTEYVSTVQVGRLRQLADLLSKLDQSEVSLNAPMVGTTRHPLGWLPLIADEVFVSNGQLCYKNETGVRAICKFFDITEMESKMLFSRSFYQYPTRAAIVQRIYTFAKEQS